MNKTDYYTTPCECGANPALKIGHTQNCADAYIASFQSITITYPRGGAHDGYAEVHMTGCAHTFRKSTYRDPITTMDKTFGADDFYYVAPCAKHLVAPPA
jgi:hypothetical protein